MAKKKDRLYHYPKGYIDPKTGKKKTGFMDRKSGARTYVRSNLEAIKKKELPFDSLTAREKAVYRGLVSNTSKNTVYYNGKQYYDPTGKLRSVLDQDPATAGKRNLTNLLMEYEFRQIADRFLQPAGKNDLMNITQRKIVDGKKLDYITRTATNLDMISRLTRLIKKGYELNVNGKKGMKALEALRKFEQKEIDKALKGKKNGNVQIFYKGLKINPFDKKIKISTKDAETRNFDDTP